MSQLNDQGQIVETALQYGRAKFALKALELQLQEFFPGTPLPQIDSIASAIERAASDGLKQRGRPKLETTTVKATTIGPMKGIISVKELPDSVSARTAHAAAVRDAIVAVLANGPMTAKKIMKALPKRVLRPKNPHAHLRYFLRNSPELIVNVSRGEYGLVSAKPVKNPPSAKTKAAAAPKVKAAPKTKAKAAPKKDAPGLSMSQVLRYLVSHGKPVTGLELVKHFKLSTARPLTPILVNLRRRGGIVEKDGVWEPIIKALETIRDEATAPAAA